MEQIRNLVFKTLRLSGLPFLMREFVQRNKVSMVMFHDPEPEYAEQAFAYLAKQYNLISLDTYLEARRTGKQNSLPPKAMIITLDDGYIGNYRLLPVIEKLKIPVTIFLCAGIINTRRHYWFVYDELDDLDISKSELKQVSNRKRLRVMAEVGFDRKREYKNAQALTKAQIDAMKPLVNFQGHTLFHPCLPNCSDENAWEEIVQSKQVLEQDFGLPINAMAYPNGDYSDREIAFIKEAGYACAVSVDFGFNTIHTNPYRLKRLSIDDSDNVDAVSVKSCGLWTFLLGLLGKRKWNRRVRPLSQQVAHAKTFFFLTYRLSTEVLNYEYTPIYIF